MKIIKEFNQLAKMIIFCQVLIKNQPKTPDNVPISSTNNAESPKKV